MMSRWFKSLSDREQRTMMLGGVVAIALLFYIFVWTPITNHINALRVKTLELKQQYNWLQQVGPRLQRHQQMRHSTDNLMNTVEQSLAKNQLAEYLQAVNQPENHQLEINLKAVPFDQFIAWLQSLVHHYQVKVFSLQAKPSKAFGTVDVQLVLNKL